MIFLFYNILFIILFFVKLKEKEKTQIFVDKTCELRKLNLVFEKNEKKAKKRTKRCIRAEILWWNCLGVFQFSDKDNKRKLFSILLGRQNSILSKTCLLVCKPDWSVSENKKMFVKLIVSFFFHIFSCFLQFKIFQQQTNNSVITIGADLDTCCNVIKDIMKHFDKVS